MNDHAELSPRAYSIIEDVAHSKVQGFINTLVLHEVVYVLEHVYEVKRKIIAEQVATLISLTSLSLMDLEKEFVCAAFDDYKSTNIDFPDCIYKQYCMRDQLRMFSFDKDFKRLGVDIEE